MICSVEGCETKVIARGWCHKHYKRWQTYGDPMIARFKRPHGTGNIRHDGYLEIQKDNLCRMAHVIVAENALGKKLPPRAKVHHVNGNRCDNRNSNLVICQDDAYHRLLHNRMNAVENGHPPHYRKCPYCKQYDDPKNLYTKGTINRHVACIKEYDKARNERRLLCPKHQ